MEVPRITCAGALLATLAATGCVAAPPGEGEPAPRVGAYVVTTGLVGLPNHHKARLALSQARPDSPDVAVEIRFKDAQGNILTRERGVIGQGSPVISRLFRRSVASRDELLVQTEILFGPVQTTSGSAPAQTGSSFGAVKTSLGPLGDTTTCPLHLTLQIVPDDDGNGPGYVCGVDPCDGGDGDPETQGPGHSGGVFPAFCDSRVVTSNGDDDV